MKVRVTTVIERPQQHVWSFFEDPEKLKLWVPGLVELRITSPSPHGPGSTYVMRMKEGRRVRDYQGETLVWDPPRRVKEHLWGEHLLSVRLMTADYRLEDLGERTRLDYENEFEARGFWRLVLPVTVLLGGIYCRAMFRTLKRVAEA